MTVAELLQASRDAHQRYREAVPHRVTSGASTVIVAGDAEVAGQALHEACRLRTEAHVLDPQRIDPAWQDEPSTHDHDTLLDFYATQLSV
jgi:hypothetical protein